MSAGRVPYRTDSVDHCLYALSTRAFIDVAEYERCSHDHICQNVAPRLQPWNDTELKKLLSGALKGKGIGD